MSSNKLARDLMGEILVDISTENETLKNETAMGENVVDISTEKH